MSAVTSLLVLMVISSAMAQETEKEPEKLDPVPEETTEKSEKAVKPSSSESSDSHTEEQSGEGASQESAGSDEPLPVPEEEKGLATEADSLPPVIEQDTVESEPWAVDEFFEKETLEDNPDGAVDAMDATEIQGSSSHGEEMAPESMTRLSIDGRLRLRHHGLTAFPIDSDGFEHGQGSFGTLLLRVRARAQYRPQGSRWGQYFIHGDLQLFDGQVYGDQSFDGGEQLIRPRYRTPIVDQILLRELYGSVNMGIGVVRIGRMMSHWGLGLLANGGDREDYAFADASHGDLSNRLLFVTKPAALFDNGRWGQALHMAIGMDYIESDELVRRRHGDQAWQVVGSLFWREPHQEFGVYVAYRDLTRPSGDLTQALATDLYARMDFTFLGTYRLSLQTEWVFISGTTEEARFDGADSPLDILQFGGALRATVDRRDDGFVASFDAGWAPGDNHPSDSTLRAIRFDPGFKVGMILFEEVLGRTSARAMDRARDPELQAEPAHGTQRIPTQGAVNNAIYLYPQLGYRLFDSRLEGRLGLLLAFSDGDVIDAFTTGLAGGYAQNTFKKSQAKGFYGAELNASLRWVESELEGFATLSLGARYGALLPGEALHAPVGIEGLGVVHKWTLMTNIVW